jgi:queuine tRNA-ribosyltransferase
MTELPKFYVHQNASTSRARRGEIVTPHGSIETPAFLFCATKGSLKGLAVHQLTDTQILLANTYHLMIQPGHELIEKLGGLHTFMGWNGPIFTDSGGYQIFSLWHGSVSQEIKGTPRFQGKRLFVGISEQGALFSSYRDGTKYLLTPEKSIAIQCALGSDLICVLDECTPAHMNFCDTQKSLALSHRWEERSLSAFESLNKTRSGLYGIVQGGAYESLRKESAEFVGSLPFFGHAIGGSLGITVTQMREVVDMALAYLPRQKPIHLLGIGGIQDIITCVEKGIDTFDCVTPTRLGRHGAALIKAHYWKEAKEDFHRREHINLWKSCFRDDPKSIEADCTCLTCKTYSRAYLHHLLKANEILAASAITLHNVHMMNCLMKDIRTHIHCLKSVRDLWLAS